MKKFWNDWKWVILAGIAIFLLGITLRLTNLTILPVFADEAIYIRWAQVMANEPTLRFLPLSDGKQPLFMWVLMFIVRKLSNPLFAGRLLSAASGIGTLIGIFFTSFYIFKSKKVALISSFFWAISPFSVFFDRMALVDSMLTFFGIWTLLLGLVTAKTLRLDMAMLTGFALGASSLTKSPAAFFAALLVLNVVFAKKLKDKIRYFGLLSVTYVIALLMYNIQRLGPNFHLIYSRSQDYIFPLSKILSNPLDPIIYNFPSAISWIWAMGPTLILIFGIAGAVFNLRKYWKEVSILFIWFLAPLVYESMFAKTFTARYILFLLPSFYILAGSIFLFGKKWVNSLLMLGLIVFTVQALSFDYRLLTDPMTAPLPRRERMGYLEEGTSGIGITQVADFIKTQTKDLPVGKQVVVGTEGYFGTLPDGLQIYLTDVPKVTVIGVGVNITEIPDSLIESKEFGNKTYLVINNSRLRANPDELNLKLIASYSKGLRHPGTSEYVDNGPQEVLYLFEVN